MAAWHHPCRAIFLCKFVQRPQRTYLKLYVWNFNRIDIAVAMQHLVFLSRVNFNRGSAAQLKIIAMVMQDCARNFQYTRVSDQIQRRSR